MVKFVIAGRADCPYYAKTELLADYLQKNLPDFRIHKITQRPEVWEDWLKDVCEKNKWSHKNSPIIWRELLDRGGKGLLLGGYNEFLEHAQLYYDVTSSMTTELMMVIAQENLGAHIEKEQEEEALKTCINPLQVWITSASAPACYNLIPILTSGEVFGIRQKNISKALWWRPRTWRHPSCAVCPSAQRWRRPSARPMSLWCWTKAPTRRCPLWRTASEAGCLCADSTGT
uniref:Malate dehydrogenase 1B n=1 Tax=Colobus angolensis palliatus TaxID=336983 RepID=A0A2K5ICJ4_COLAP